LSRVIAGKLELDLRTLDLSALVHAAIDVVSPDADAKGIRLNVATMPMTVVGDAGRLQQVFWNLLSNAVKFTPRGGEVRVRLEQTDSQVRIQVTDTGQGIRRDFLPFVFDRFKQGEGDMQRRSAGLGLGLALVSEIVQAHGGTVDADSPGEGRGSTFTVVLPVRAAPTTPATTKPSTRAATAELLTNIRVLIVDDEADVRELLTLILESRGGDVRAVSSAAEAFEAIDSFKPDVLLADLRMPEEDGYSLIHKVRARERERRSEHLSAIAVTAYASPSDRARALDAGYDGHLAKPVVPDEVVRVVADVAAAVAGRQEPM
jgi:CheY-like chemotaxis protein/anti-sigma regulatory factor (Ser/Thr protein kinase)